MNRSSTISDLMKFLENSPTAFHAVESLLHKLNHNHFEGLKEEEKWSLEPEKKYVVTRNGSSLCAFVTPKHLPKKVRLLASHTDSPGFKLKPNPLIKKNGALLFGVEVYGSPIISSWLNRDLGLAGRIVGLNKNDQVIEKNIRLEQTPLIIPQLAIHLDREVNEKGVQINKQEHLNVLVGLTLSVESDDLTFESFIQEHIECKELLGHDLFLYPLEKPRLVGYGENLLSSYRIDSLSSVHAALTALLNQSDPLTDEIKMVIFWDHEEIGSHTAQGAESTFFTQVVERILNAYQGTKEDYYCLINRSTCISIDLAHALHPNYPEKHDPHHQPILGNGIVIKNHAQQKYATNALSGLPIHLFSKEARINLQTFVSRNDQPCGSTIGPIHACIAGMQTVDIGCGQLSMHSCRELMSCQDHLDMCRLLEKTFSKP